MLSTTYLRFPTGLLPNPSDTKGMLHAPDHELFGDLYRVFPTTLGLVEAAGRRTWDTLLDPPQPPPGRPGVLPRAVKGFSVGVHGQLIRGTDILWAGHGLGWKKREIDEIAIADRAIELFRMAEKTAPARSGDMPVIFTPEGMSVLLLALRLGFNGKNVLLKASPLAGKEGERVADERFSLTDDPLLDWAGGSAAYDGEGVPHRQTPLLEGGVVRGFLYDLDTAGRAGRESTGNGIGCGPTNLVVATGDTPFERMVSETERGLLVHSVIGLGQGNPLSGEFSVNVNLGYLIEKGKVVGRVKDTMLAGNTYEALREVEAIGDRAEWAGGRLLTPPVKISRLSVVAR